MPGWSPAVSPAVSVLHERAEQYVAMRRSLGYKFHSQARMLADFAGFLEARGDTTITVTAALAWATAPDPASAAFEERRHARGSGRHALKAVEILTHARGFRRHLRERFVVTLRAAEEVCRQHPAADTAGHLGRCLPGVGVVRLRRRAVLAVFREHIAAHVEPPAVRGLIADRRQGRPVLRSGRRLDGKPGVALYGEVERIAGFGHRAVRGGKIGLAGGREGDRLRPGAGNHVLEFHAGGAKADGRGIGDIVGDGVQTALERNLRGEGDVETVLHGVLRTSASAWPSSDRSRCRPWSVARRAR